MKQVYTFFAILALLLCVNVSYSQEISGTNGTEQVTVSVYPNPAVSTIEISSTESIESFYIYNTLGTIVYSDKVQATSTKVTISDLPKGVYILRCNGLTKRFVKK